jgi:hypothetical protein
MRRGLIPPSHGIGGVPAATKGRKGTRSKGRKGSRSPRSKFPHVHLSAGPYRSDGAPTHEVEFDGELLASNISEGSRIVWGVGGQSSLRVERALYLLRSEAPFAVHSVLQSVKDSHPMLARVTFYFKWAEVVREHPDLARSALSHHSELLHSHEHAHPVAPPLGEISVGAA